jgi:hypothetical protein
MTIAEALNELFDLVKSLGIPEYFDGLDDENIIILGLHHYSQYIQENLNGIKEDMESDNEVEEELE